MTNEQLAVFITAWANKIEQEIADIQYTLEEDDSPNLARYKEWRQIGKDGELHRPLMVFTSEAVRRANPDQWTEINTDFMLLDGLKGLHKELLDAIQSLTGDEHEQ